MFGDVLKFLREERRLSQKDLATAIGVGHSTITKYERNERQPNFKTLIQVADYFNVSTDLLLDRYMDSTSEIIAQIIVMLYALDKELQIERSLPESIDAYKNHKTQIDRLLLDLLSLHLS